MARRDWPRPTEKTTFSRRALVATTGVLLVLLGPLPEWASNTGFLSRMAEFGDGLAVLLNGVVRFFLVLFVGVAVTIAVIRWSLKSRSRSGMILGLLAASTLV